MDGLDDTRVVRLRVAPLDQEGRRWRFGSGYLAGPGRILTACHVLRPPDTEQLPTRGDSCDVLLWPCDSDEGWLPASVEWVDPDRDVAVVALSSDRAVPAVRFGRLAGAPVLSWRARGFPIAALGSEGRQPESAWGRLSPAGEGSLALTVESRRPGKRHDGESGWAGLSGAAVFCGAYLVGVVTTDPAQWVRSLEASSVAPVTEDGEFREALGHHAMAELVRESSRAAGVTINVARATAALGARVALAPPKFGEWGLVGREQDLARLHDHLSGHGQAAVVPVAGLGGLGKTALALSYAARYGAGYDLVAWVDAERAELIPGQYRALVRNRTGQDLPETEAVAAAKALLANTESCLVVFDNASSPAELHPYLPAGEGRVLVTTRNETWSANAELTVSLDKLPRPVVVRWLTRALPGSSADAIERLAERLDGLPLAIVQAIAYITARPGESASSYLDRLATKSGQRDLLEAKTPPGYPRPVATTWDLAAETLAAEAPQALELLRHLAFVNPDRIPLAVIDGLLPGTDTPALLDALRNLGMIRCSSTHASLHRLVQDVTRWSLAEEEGTYVQRWARQLRGASSDPEDHAAFEWYADIAAHVLTLADHASLLHLSAPDLGVLITHTGVSLRLQAAYTLALTLLEQALGINEAAYGPDHSQMAIILLNLGNAHHELGHYQKAIGLYDRALPIFEGAYGPDHPKVAITLSNLGLTHQRLGGYQEAIGLYDGALRILEGAYGPVHPEVARTLTNLDSPITSWVATRRRSRSTTGPCASSRAPTVPTTPTWPAI
jgi:tetratricopeptide (TPR) repeat protein